MAKRRRGRGRSDLGMSTGSTIALVVGGVLVAGVVGAALFASSWSFPSGPFGPPSY